MNLVRSWPQQQAGAAPLGWRWAQPLMPPRINGWPQGVVPSSDAEALLESAVAWWDASRYRDGDRWLRNQGIAGDLLDLRLGSSTVANSNDPQFLAPAQTGYVYLPGVISNYLSVPDQAALRITGDIDIQCLVAMDSWTPSAATMLAAKWNTGQLSYRFFVNTNGRLFLQWTTDGSTVIGAQSSVATSVADGTIKWVRVTLTVNNGASANEAKFYLSDDGSTWTQLGTTVTTAGVTSIYSGTAIVEMGSNLVGNNVGPMRYYRVIVKSGIDGTTVLDVDCDAITSGSATSFTATTGQTVTINRSTSGRKSVAQPARGKGGRACFLLGTDDYFEVPSDRVWQHQLLNFRGGDLFTCLIVCRRWASDTAGGFITKRDGVGATAGWGIHVESGGIYSGTADGTSFSFNNFGAATLGNGSGTIMFTGVFNGPTGVITNYLGAAVTSVSSQAVRSLNATTAATVKVGTYSTVYLDFEFLGAAIFRRALTAAEITSITRYYGAS